MAEEKRPREKPRRPAQNGARPARRPIPKRHVYSLDDMVSERDGMDIFGTVYEFVGPSDIGAEKLSEIGHLETRVREQELEQAGSSEGADLIDAHIAGLDADTDADLINLLAEVSRRMRAAHFASQEEDQVDELLRLCALRTAAIFDDALPDEVQGQLTLRQHEWIRGSFMQASTAAGERLAEAMEATKAKASKT